MAIRHSQVQVELREVALNDKPPELIQISAKATVPVLQQTDGAIIDQSLDIMLWALHQNDPHNWLQTDLKSAYNSLIGENDQHFKPLLDYYKYADRFPERSQRYYRQQTEPFLQTLEQRLLNRPFLLGQSPGLADIALFPFIRQFAYVDISWFNSTSYYALQTWLKYWLTSELFLSSMLKYPDWEHHQPLTIF